MFVKFQLLYYSVTSDSACVGSGSGSGFGSVFGSELEWLDDELLEELDELLAWLDEDDELLECDGSLYDDCELEELELELSSSSVGAVSSGTSTSSPYFARGSFAASMKT